MVLRGVRRPAGDDQALVGVEAAEGLDKELGALLGHDASEEEHIRAPREPPALGDDVRRTWLLGLYAVGDEAGLAPVRLSEIALGRAGEHDDLVGATGGVPLPHFDVGARQLAPLGTLPVEPVDGRDRADSRVARERQRDARALGVVVNDVRMVLDRRKRGEEARGERRHALGVDGADGYHADVVALVGLGRCRFAVDAGTRAVVAGDLVAEHRHTAGKLRDHDLHAALARAVSLVANHRDAHRSTPPGTSARSRPSGQ